MGELIPAMETVGLGEVGAFSLQTYALVGLVGLIVGIVLGFAISRW